MQNFPQPWLEDALERLDVRPRDRALVFPAPTLAHVAAVRRLSGGEGRTMVIEPILEQAERIASTCRDDVQVVNDMPTEGDQFGTFDAVLVCPLHLQGLTVDLIVSFLASNLRPGGRFVVDLPAENESELLTQTWLEAGGDERALAPLQGPPEDELAQALRQRGLRSVEASMGVHLLRLENVSRLGALLDGMPFVESDAQESLDRMLIEKLRTNQDVEVLFHRCRVAGLR